MVMHISTHGSGHLYWDFHWLRACWSVATYNCVSVKTLWGQCHNWPSYSDVSYVI